MQRSVEIPSGLYQPFSLQVSKDYPRLRQVTNAWAQSTGIITSQKATERFVKTDFSYLTATTFPKAPWSKLVLIDQFVVLLFMLDDQVDDATLGQDPELVKEVLWDLFSTLDERRSSNKRAAAAAASKMCGSAFKRAFSTWWRELVPYTNLSWRHRFRIAMAQYFESYVNEVRNRNDNKIPLIEEYILLRRDTGAVRPVFLLVEIEQDLHHLTPELLTHPTIQTLENYSNDIICWSNDIFSCDKERAKGDVHNLVIAVENEKRTDSFQDAADIVGRMIEDRTRDFQRLRNVDPSKKIHLPNVRTILPHLTASQAEIVTDELHKYVDGLQFWIPGNFQWSLKTRRYASCEISRKVDYVEDILQINAEPAAPAKPDFEVVERAEPIKPKVEIALSA